MNTSTIVITGAGGFVGNHLTHELLHSSSFKRIIGLDKSITDMPDVIERHAVDITNPESFRAIMDEAKPEWVIHLAAVASVPFAIANPELTKTINVFGTKNVLEVARQVSSKSKFLIISSSDIYGKVSPEILPEKPLSDCHPSNPYAQSKLEMEGLVEREYNDRCIRVRPFPHIGAGQRQGFATADFAFQIANIESGKQEPVMSVGNLDAIRDFTDVRDVVRAYRLLMESGELGQVYHVASGIGTPIREILEKLLRLSTSPIKIVQDSVRMRPSDNPVMIGSAEKIYQQTGWRTSISLDDSLRDVLEYWRK